MTTGKIYIKSELDERELIELCLNLRYSGYDYSLPLSLHALTKSWKYKKLIYYIDLIENEN